MERLARQVQEAQRLLQQPDTDWKDASSSIEELATAVETLGRADNYKDAVRLLVGISRDIGLQIISIRSRLVKDVCGHLLRIVKVTERDFQDLANALLPQIVNTAKSSSAAIRQPGSKLLNKMSELVRYDVSLMRKIFAQFSQDKVRVLLLEQLRIIFVYWSNDEVMAWESDVMEMIQRGLDDQNASVRKMAREVLTRFSSRWSERVDELVDMPTTQSKVLLLDEHPDSPLAVAILEKNPELANKADVLSRSRRTSFLDKRASFHKSPRNKREHNIEIHVSATPPPKQREQQEILTQNTGTGELYMHDESAVEGIESAPRGRVAVSQQLFVDSTVSNFDDDKEDDIPEEFSGSQMHGYHPQPTTGAVPTQPLESNSMTVSSVATVVSSRLTIVRSGSVSSVEEAALRHPSVKKLKESKIPSPLNRSPSLRERKRLDSPSRGSSSPELRPSLLPRPNSFTLKAPGSNDPSSPADMEEEVDLQSMRGRTVPLTPDNGANVDDEQIELKPLSASDEFFSKPIPSSMATPTPPPPPTDNVTFRPRRRTIVRPEDSHLEAYTPEVSSPEQLSGLPPSELTQNLEAEVAHVLAVRGSAFGQEAPASLDGNRYAGYTSDEVDDLSHLTDGSDHVVSDNKWDRRRLDDSQSQSGGESEDVADENGDQLEQSGEHSFFDEWRLDEGPRYKFNCDDIGDRLSEGDEDETGAGTGVENERTTVMPEPNFLDVNWRGRTNLLPGKHLTMPNDFGKEAEEENSAQEKTDTSRKDALEALLNVRNEMARLRAITRNEEDSHGGSFEQEMIAEPLRAEPSSTTESSHMQSPVEHGSGLQDDPKTPKSSYLKRLVDADHFERQASPSYALHDQPDEINFLGQRASHGGRTSPSQTFEQDLDLAVNADAAEDLEERNFFLELQAQPSSRPQTGDEARRKVDEVKPEQFNFAKESHSVERNPPLEKNRQDHHHFDDHDQAGRFHAAEKLFAAKEPISSHGCYDRPQSLEPESYMHPEPYRVRAPPTPMGAKLSPTFSQVQKNMVTEAASGNVKADAKDDSKLRMERDTKNLPSDQPVPSFVETLKVPEPLDDKDDAKLVAPENAASTSLNLPAIVPERTSPPAKLGWASSFGITAVMFLAAMFGMAGIMRAAKMVHDSHEYHLALKSRIDMFEASIAESHEKVLKLEEDYAVWSEYVRKLTEEDELNALTQLEAIQVEVQKWQQEMKADLVEFRQALSVDSIEAAFASMRVNNTPQIEP